MAHTKNVRKTLLMSVIMSSPGPLVVGLGLLVGRSSTQIADFVRRSIELLAIILSFAVFCMTVKDDGVDEAKKQKYEKYTNIFVSVAMVVSGIIMIILAVASDVEETGNVIPSLVIALLGLVANSYFWMRYRKLGTLTGNKLLVAQSNLYRGKTLVDSSVFVALGVVLLAKDATVSYTVDLVGTVCVSIYLAFTGSKMLYNECKRA